MRSCSYGLMKIANSGANVLLERCCGLAGHTLYPWKRKPKQVQLMCVCLDLCASTWAQTSGLPSYYDVCLCFGERGFGIMNVVSS